MLIRLLWRVWIENLNAVNIKSSCWFCWKWVGISPLLSWRSKSCKLSYLEQSVVLLSERHLNFHSPQVVYCHVFLSLYWTALNPLLSMNALINYHYSYKHYSYTNQGDQNENAPRTSSQHSHMGEANHFPAYICCRRMLEAALSPELATGMMTSISSVIIFRNGAYCIRLAVYLARQHSGRLCQSPLGRV